MRAFASQNEMLAALCTDRSCVVVAKRDSAAVSHIASLKPRLLRIVDARPYDTEYLAEKSKRVIREPICVAQQFIRNGSVDVIYCIDDVSAVELMILWQKLSLGGTLLTHSKQAMDAFARCMGLECDIYKTDTWGVARLHGNEIEVLEDCDIAIIGGDGSIGSWVFGSRRLDYDTSFLNFVTPFIKPDKAALDIGAFIGSHTSTYLKFASAVVAFEPNPVAFSCLRYNCPTAICHNVALGDNSRNHYWTRIYPNCGASYLADEPSPGCRTVPVRTLDSIPLPKEIGYAKIDAEGEEVAILRGGRATILKHKPVLCIEVNHPALARTGTSADELYALLKEYGYQCQEIPGTAYGTQLDILATPRRP